MLLKRFSRACAAVAGTALVASLSVVPTGAAAGEDPHKADPAQVLLDWERTAFATIYPPAPSPWPGKTIPGGVPILGFTSMAMYDAAQMSLDRGRSSETAAVAAAAHGVLVHYFPAASSTLDAKLAASLATVPHARAEAKGLRIGRRAAARMLASRAGDGFEDMSIHYTKDPGLGIWQPVPPNTDMIAAWLGSLRPLVLDSLVQVDGPDPLTSAAYAADYEEVRTYGRTGVSARSPWQTDTAYFFNSNSATMVGDAVIRRLEANPVGLRTTALLFARMHASMTDSLIKCWQLKRDVGFWRPFQAINHPDDGNPATTYEPGWAPLLATPNYSEYPSGHGCLTGPAVETVRMMLGEHTALELRWAGTVQQPTSTIRTYEHLTDIETDALNARIWGGLHFRDAMDDAYLIGHTTAHRVAAEIH